MFAIQHSARVTAFVAITAMLGMRGEASPRNTTAADTLAGPGVSIELARIRAASVRDVRYDLSFDITPLDSAFGRVTVAWTRTGGGDAFIDFRGRRLLH